MRANLSLHVMTFEPGGTQYIYVVHIDLTELLGYALKVSCFVAGVACYLIQVDVSNYGVVASIW